MLGNLQKAMDKPSCNYPIMRFWPVGEKVDVAEIRVMEACGFWSLLCFHKVSTKWNHSPWEATSLPSATPLLNPARSKPLSHASHCRAPASLGAQALSVGKAITKKSLMAARAQDQHSNTKKQQQLKKFSNGKEIIVREGPIFTFIMSFPTECLNWLLHASVPTSGTAVVK